MEIATLILMVVPFVFAVAYYCFPHAERSETLTWLWAICTLACFAWGFLIRRKHPARAWACVVIGFLQLLLMSMPAFKPVKTRGPEGETAGVFRPNLSPEPTAAGLFACGCAFVAPWFGRSTVPGGCGSAPR